MNIGILLLGLVGGAAVGGGLFLQSQRARRRRLDIAARGERATVTIVSVRVTGRFAGWRQVKARTATGYEFMATLAALQAGQLGLVEGAQAEATIVSTEPGMGQFTDPAAAHHGSGVAVAAGFFIAALGVAAALVT